MSFQHSFREELRLLKKLSAEVVTRHPNLAPMLSDSADPDVERLFQGTAFLTSMLRQKIDDDFPELINHLIGHVSPHRIIPFPSATIVAFTPKPTLRQSQIISAGTQLASVPVEGSSYIFATASDLEIHPLILDDAAFSHPAGKAPVITLHFQLQNLRLADWAPRSLRLSLAGEYGKAADLYLLLMRHLERVTITPRSGGEAITLSPAYLQPAGVMEGRPGWQLQEYFIIPEKFLALQLSGFERWRDRGSGSAFEVAFHLEKAPPVPCELSTQSFRLFTVPAVNLFRQKVQPVWEDGECLVRGDSSDNCHIHSVDGVTGYLQGGLQRRMYRRASFSDPGGRTDYTYRTIFRRKVMEPGCDVILHMEKPVSALAAEDERLEIDVRCTNGDLSDRIGIGYVRLGTDCSPDCADFENITAVTAEIVPALGNNELWQFYSMLQMQATGVRSREGLVSMLSQFVPEESSATAAATKRLAGILELTVREEDRLTGPSVMRGRELSLKVTRDAFQSMGDLFLFGALLNQFLGQCTRDTTFTRLTVHVAESGEIFSWDPQTGSRGGW